MSGKRHHIGGVVELSLEARPPLMHPFSLMTFSIITSYAAEYLLLGRDTNRRRASSEPPQNNLRFGWGSFGKKLQHQEDGMPQDRLSVPGMWSAVTWLGDPRAASKPNFLGNRGRR